MKVVSIFSSSSRQGHEQAYFRKMSNYSFKDLHLKKESMLEATDRVEEPVNIERQAHALDFSGD